MVGGSAPPTGLQTAAATASGTVGVLVKPVQHVLGVASVPTQQAEVGTPCNQNEVAEILRHSDKGQPLHKGL